jgi:hypothetical protein
MIVILSPHPDDAVLSLWHVLAGEEDVVVLNVFGGTPPPGAPAGWWDRLTGASDPATRAGERAAEDRAALALAGREPAELGLPGGQYGEAPLSVTPLAGLLTDAAPEGTLLAPAALDRHRSHAVVRDAALELRAEGREVVLYADVPHATVYGWPAWVTGAEPDARLRPEAGWEGALAGTGLALGEPGAEVERLDPAKLARKREAVGAYRTQLPALEAQFGALDDEVLGHEVTWRVSP